MSNINKIFANNTEFDVLEQLKQRIQQKKVRIGIYGLGYVGLPLALRFSEIGLKIIGLDIDQNKVDQLNQGQS